MSNLAIHLSFRAVGQTHVKWQAFEKMENKRNVWRSGLGGLTTIHLSLTCLAQSSET